MEICFSAIFDFKRGEDLRRKVYGVRFTLARVSVSAVPTTDSNSLFRTASSVYREAWNCLGDKNLLVGRSIQSAET